MAWFHKLPFSKKIFYACYVIAAFFAIPTLVTFIIVGKIFTGIFLTLILLTLTFPIAIYLRNVLSDSFTTLSHATARVAKGDFTGSINATGGIGDLSVSFNSMVNKLRSILQETSQITRKVMNSSNSISDKNHSLIDVMIQVGQSSNELAIGAGEISQDIGNMTKSINDIEHKINDYTTTTQVMNQRSSDTLQLVETGRSAISRQVSGMRKNIDATSKVASTIQALAESARDITLITTSISEIADQTNLLSLNASIEAARAGEQGAGFAVVAHEVRKLAEESTKSTKEVFKLVQIIDRDIKEANESMILNEKIVKEQGQLMVEAEQVFNQIIDSVQYIGKQVEDFARESISMLESAKTISNSIQNISLITEQFAAGTEEVSASMNEQIASIQAMAAESETMKNAVMQLNKTINIFKF
ncbi:HAMP domain-containing methyl-accepting chemotaxis protein [Paenibacillus turicensis]|uniref:methyl-accepting chemotaxis protein n=1 Tax=Paenibacillus turicensis TaxID=160487 RepID=UPI003D2E1DA5